MNKFVLSSISLLFGALIGFAVGAGVFKDSVEETPIPSTSKSDDNSTIETKDAPSEEIEKPSHQSPPAGNKLSDIIANTETPVVPAGNGTITGRVLTETGEPVTGVKITARPTYPDERKWNGKNTEERILDTIRYERWKELSKRTATTDIAGKYSLEGLNATEEYRIAASLEKWEIVRADGVKRVKAGAEVNFVATRVYSLSIEVQLPDGSLAGDVYVYRSGSKNPHSSSGERIENGRGKIKLGADEWTFSGSYGENNEYSIEEQSISIGPESTVTSVVLQLKGRPGVTGKVKISTKYIDTTFVVYLIKNPPTEAPGNLVTLLDDDPESDYLWDHDHDDGNSREYSFMDVEAGQYRLILVFDDKIAEWKDVAIGDNLETVNLEMPEPKIADYIVLTVSAPDGSRLSGIDIRLTIEYRHGSSSSGANVVAGDNNEYWVHRRKIGKEITEWTYNIEITHGVYGSLTKTFKHDDTSVQECQFQEPATVTLTVLGFNEYETESKMHWRLVGEHESEDVWFDEDDEKKDTSPFTFGPLQPGKYSFVLEKVDSHRESEIYRQEVTLQAGENEFSIAMPQMYALTVNCRDNAEARRMDISRIGADRWSSDYDKKTDAKTVTYSDISAGDYILYSKNGRMKVTVPTNGPIDFSPREYDCVVFSDIKAGGIIEGLGLMNDDKLFEIDGVVCEDVKVFQSHFRISASKESTTWVVMRNGVRTSITFNGKSLMAAMENRRENGEDLDFDPGYLND